MKKLEYFQLDFNAMCRNFEIVNHTKSYTHMHAHTLVLLLLAPNILKGRKHSDCCKGDPAINRNTQNRSLDDMKSCKMTLCLQE